MDDSPAEARSPHNPSLESIDKKDIIKGRQPEGESRMVAVNCSRRQ
jgi:hypothetical protein